jgi:Zn-finger protein
MVHRYQVGQVVPLTFAGRDARIAKQFASAEDSEFITACARYKQEFGVDFQEENPRLCFGPLYLVEDAELKKTFPAWESELGEFGNRGA